MSGSDRLALSPAVAVALDGARTAPSRFNAQPWLFGIAGDDAIRVGWDPERWLAVADPQRRLATYALGCAIEAIDHLVECEWREPFTERPQDAGWCAGELALGAPRERELLVRRAVLDARATNRGKYLCDGLDHRVLAVAQRAAADRGIELAVVDQPTQSDRIAAAAAASVEQALENDAYLDVLTRGLPAVGRVGLAELAAGARARDLELLGRVCAVPSLRRRAMRSGLAAALSRRTYESTRNSAALLVLASAADDSAARVRAGRALMRVWLILTDAGYAAQPQLAPLQNADGTERTREAARIGSDRTLTGVLRVGRALSAPPRAPRLALERLLADTPRTAQNTIHVGA